MDTQGIKQLMKNYNPPLRTRIWIKWVRIRNSINNFFKFSTHKNFKVGIPRHLRKDCYNWHYRDNLMAHYMFEIMCQFVGHHINQNYLHNDYKKQPYYEDFTGEWYESCKPVNSSIA